MQDTDPTSSRPALGVRAADAADLPAMADLLQELFAQEAEFEPDAEAQRRGLQALLDDPAHARLLVATGGPSGQVLGMVSLLFTISTALGAPVAWVEDLVVTASARGHGLGEALMQAAISEAQERGCRRLTLLTDADNRSAQRFYARLGFTGSPMVPLRLLLSP